MNTQLSNPETYDVKRMVFSKAIKGESAEGGPKINFYRIMVNTQNEDGTVGELIFPTSELFSFGVSANVAMDGSGTVSGHSLPLCLWNKDNPLPVEKAFSSKLDEVVERVKDHLLEPSTKAEIQKYDLDRSDLKKLNSFIYWKKEKGVVVEGTGPTLYPKLIESKKTGKVITSFFDAKGEELDPFSLMGKYCYVKAAIKIESIFIGAKINIQVKVYEAEVRLIEQGTKRLLKRPASDTSLSAQPAFSVARTDSTINTGISKMQVVESDEDDDDRIQDDDAPAPAPAPQPAPVASTTDQVARKPLRTVKPKTTK